MHRLAWLDMHTGTLIRRYERERPGELIHVDVKDRPTARRRRLVCRVAAHSAVNGIPAIERVMTDNARGHTALSGQPTVSRATTVLSITSGCEARCAVSGCGAGRC
jgi:hypothetical protein